MSPFVVWAIATSVSMASPAPAQRSPRFDEARGIKRDVPVPRAIIRARRNGTRGENGHPGPSYWQLRTDYTIRARLDPATGTVTGRETIRVRNDSPDPLVTLHLRLDQNLFRPGARRDARIGEETDGMVVTRLVVGGQPAEIGSSPVRAPRQPLGAPMLSGTTRTSERVTLARPLTSGATATLEIDWHFRVPRDEGGAAIRMGRWGDSVYQVAQWYPRVAVYDDLGGWDTAEYLGEVEFYNPFGRFDVSLDVPAGWLVGATGVLQNPDEVLTSEARARLAHVTETDARVRIVGPEEPGSGIAGAAGRRQLWRFVADTVSDFAWAASDRYVWDASRATIPGRGPIPVHFLYTPGHAQRFVRGDSLVRHALELFSRLVTPYAFPQLTFVDGPERGMEYPMLVMSDDGVAVHEVAHQWWPMTAGSDETRYPFLDEGLASYMAVLAAADGERGPVFAPGGGRRYGRTAGDDRGETLLRADDGRHAAAPTVQSYSRPVSMLRMLGGMASDSAVWHALGEYTRAWRFRHPSPWDFMAVLGSTLGQDLGWFWQSWLYSTESVDGAIERVSSIDGRARITVRRGGGMPAPVVLAVECVPGGPPMRVLPNARPRDRAGATLVYPVEIWFGSGRTFTADVDLGCELERVTLDPMRRFPDRDASDNVWERVPMPRPR